ncbi:diacylglycerol kinase (ATP) [Pedobacter sp. UYP30]|uniref:diacylglycerol/lipid kinase family protein n=1 Tax=Pedobacter sp. UYP30 TaxID=1756400 RepID=UPI003398B52B
MKLLFIINPGSGNHNQNFKEIISEHFLQRNVVLDFYELPKDCSLAKIREKISNSDPDRVVAVGGDGTLKLVAECVLHKSIPIGLVATGSANGMAKELGIPLDIPSALNLIETGKPKAIHVVKVNDEICIHLADMGFNAYLIKIFDALPQRGMLGYAKAAWLALLNHKKMQVSLKLGGEIINTKAAMVAIANATMYGSGLKINPLGKLDDKLFEVVLVKKYSYYEILKMWITSLPLNPEKIEVLQASEVTITARKKTHFQVDGEYLGKVDKVHAEIMPAAISVILEGGKIEG